MAALEIIRWFAGKISIKDLLRRDPVGQQRGGCGPGAHPDEHLEVIDSEALFEQIVQGGERSDLEEVPAKPASRQRQGQL